MTSAYYAHVILTQKSSYAEVILRRSHLTDFLDASLIESNTDLRKYTLENFDRSYDFPRHNQKNQMFRESFRIRFAPRSFRDGFSCSASITSKMEFLRLIYVNCLTGYYPVDNLLKKNYILYIYRFYNSSSVRKIQKRATCNKETGIILFCEFIVFYTVDYRDADCQLATAWNYPSAEVSGFGSD